VTELVQQLAILGRRTTASTADFGYHGDRSSESDRFFSCCIPPTCCCWLMIAVYRRTCTVRWWMILSYMGSTHRPKLFTSRRAFLTVLMRSRLGCMRSNRLQLNANKTEFIWPPPVVESTR